MKFSCRKESLERAIIACERFTGKNITLPILGNILFEVRDALLFLTATNLEFAIQVSLHGGDASPGKITIPAKIISTLVQSIREEKIHFEEKQGNLFIKTDTKEVRINGIPPDDFPLLPKIKKTHVIFTHAATLGRALEKVLPAVLLSEFKPELSGVFFSITAQSLCCAATDTFRLAEKTIPLSSPQAGESFSFILPHRIAQELTRLAHEDGDFEIGVGENQVIFHTDTYTVFSRLIEGNFPEYRAIIPKNFRTSCFLKKSECSDAVRAASIFSSKLHDVTISSEGKKMNVGASNPEVGEYATHFPIEASGKDTAISFNYRYLLDGLQALDEEEIFMGMNDEHAPTLVRNREDHTFLYALMPILT